MAKPSSTHRSIIADALRGAHSARRLSQAIGFLACLTLATSLGCRHIDNAQVDVLESELRKQEDYIYELEEYLMEYSEKLRQARAMQCDPVVTTPATSGRSSGEPTLDVGTVKRPTLPMNGREKLAPSTKSSLPAPPATTEAPPADFEATPADEAPAEEISPDQMEAPALEIGPGVQSAPRRTFESAAAPLLIPDPIDYQADAEEIISAERAAEELTAGPLAAEAASPTPELNAGPDAMSESELAESAPLLAAPQVGGERLSANHLQIRRVFAEHPETDPTATSSLLIVVEALNATDEPVGAEGEASLMIMARDENGATHRVERWDFTPEETASAWQSSQLGDGLHLQLPLAKSEFAEGDLELWARIVTADGRKLLTQIPFEPTQLASMADFDAEAALAAEEPTVAPPMTAGIEPIPVDQPSSTQVAAAPITQTVAEEPKPTWRPSTVRLNENRVDGFATTAGDSATSIASRTSESGGKPSWKRSSAAISEAKRDWAPFR